MVLKILLFRRVEMQLVPPRFELLVSEFALPMPGVLDL